MKTGIAVLLAVLCLFASAAFAEGSFDLSLFENDPDFEVTYSEDGGNVKADIIIPGMLQDGDETKVLFCLPCILSIDADQMPFAIAFGYYYLSDAAIEPRQIEIASEKTTCTFVLPENPSSIETSENGDTTEIFMTPFYDQALQLMREIADDGLDSVTISIKGNRTVSGFLVISDDNREKLAKMYNTYVLAGGLNGNYSMWKLLYPNIVQSVGGNGGKSAGAGTGPQGATSSSSATMGETNALKSAQSYLSWSAFSYTGLIDQLEYEGYTTAEATYAADHCGADWKEQAAKSAASYLEYTGFSRSGLIEQLEFEGFTHEQAVYGVEQNGY